MKRPNIDACEKIFAEPSLSDGCDQVSVRACDQLEITLYFEIRSQWKETLFLNMWM